MDILLDPIELRVVGALVEKELTTPDAYPLSLASLTTACNQKSNRDPVMSLREDEVVAALDGLMKRHLVREKSGAGSRVPKYAHRLSSSLYPEQQLSRRELALLAVLMLRGPQTVGELRTRTARMADFTDLEQVENTLLELATRNDGPYVAELPRRPGQREQRYRHLFAGDTPPPVEEGTIDGDEERVAALEREVSDLRGELQALRTELEALRRGE